MHQASWHHGPTHIHFITSVLQDILLPKVSHSLIGKIDFKASHYIGLTSKKTVYSTRKAVSWQHLKDGEAAGVVKLHSIFIHLFASINYAPSYDTVISKPPTKLAAS